MWKNNKKKIKERENEKKGVPLHILYEKQRK